MLIADSGALSGGTSFVLLVDNDSEGVEGVRECGAEQGKEGMGKAGSSRLKTGAGTGEQSLNPHNPTLGLCHARWRLSHPTLSVSLPVSSEITPRLGYLSSRS